MAKTKIQKQEILRDLEQKINKSKSIIFTSFNALGVKDNEELRNKLRAEQGEYYVVKKSLLDLAFKDKSIENLLIRDLPGKLAVSFAYEDEISTAKVIASFRKGKEDKIKFLGGILEGRLLSEEEVTNLASIPSKPELYAQLVGSLNAPVSGLVNALSGNLRNLINVLKALADAKA